MSRTPSCLHLPPNSFRVATGVCAVIVRHTYAHQRVQYAAVVSPPTTTFSPVDFISACPINVFQIVVSKEDEAHDCLHGRTCRSYVKALVKEKKAAGLTTDLDEGKVAVIECES